MTHLVPVLVTIDISKELLCNLREVSPQLKIDQTYCNSEEAVTEAVGVETEVLYARHFPTRLQNGSRLRWIQYQAAGLDVYLNHPLIRTPVMITTTSGAHAGPGAEFVVGLMIALGRGIPQLVKNQSQHQWSPADAPEIELRGKTLGIVGYGSIGRELARLASALGMRILAVKRNVHDPRDADNLAVFPGDPNGRLPERIFPPAQVKVMLAEADFVVVAAPLTRDTAGMIGEDELRVMKPTSYLINVARGSVVTMTALTRALKENRIAGAAVDVFESEPLDSTSDLWELPNLLITPHVMASRANPKYDERCNGIFAENLRRYLAGAPLLNLVRKDAGY